LFLTLVSDVTLPEVRHLPPAQAGTVEKVRCPAHKRNKE
jgi:hypothetical protein